MLILPHSLRIKHLVEMSPAQTQALVRFETLIASWGLEVSILCIPCRKAGEDGACFGDASYTPEVGMTFKVDCGCTERSYRGHDVVAPPPPKMPKMTERKSDAKTQRAISRRELDILQDAESVLAGLQLQYAMRCLRCRLNYEASDGVFGSREGGETSVVVECACTKRTYTGPNVTKSMPRLVSSLVH